MPSRATLRTYISTLYGFSIPGGACRRIRNTILVLSPKHLTALEMKNYGGRVARLLLCVVFSLATFTHAFAQAWPAKQVRLVLSQPPGSSPDILARLLAERLTKRSGQAVLVENRPGRPSIAGAQVAAEAAADGYTSYYATTAAP